MGAHSPLELRVNVTFLDTSYHTYGDKKSVMKVCVHYSANNLQFYGNFVFFFTRDLNVKIELGKQLFWIQHIQIM